MQSARARKPKTSTCLFHFYQQASNLLVPNNQSNSLLLLFKLVKLCTNPTSFFSLYFPQAKTMSLRAPIILCMVFTIFSFSLNISQSQSPSPPASSTCNEVFLSYAHTGGYSIPPIDQANQAYRFESTLTILNNGRNELKSWQVFVGFQHNELLVSLTNAVLADGSSLPAEVGNGTVLVGFPVTDLESAIETAGDLSKMQVQVMMVGTEYGVGDPDVPLPATMVLTNDGYSCSGLTKQGDKEIHVCCTRNLVSPMNSTEDEFLPRQEGDLIIMYDVISSNNTNYWAQVSISNHNPLGRLDNWKLSWEWKRHEFIYAMKGAYPSVLDTTHCLFGSQGQYYKDMDFSLVLNCEKRPTVIDLPPTRANDSALGRIPFCCRNGTILPPNMDPSKSISVFQMQVFKMPPDLNRTKLLPPQNWKINGSFGSQYQCGSPVRVSSSKFPDPNSLPWESVAVASWQVVCNITDSKEAIPRCCVSFSAFFNDSIVPCSTCACGCNKYPSQTCSVNAPALLLQPKTLLIPFENRTRESLEWARMKNRPIPNPLPCGDNCGVTINWNLHSDYRNDWTARITLFNWGETEFADWFVAVELDKATPGFEAAYSFNSSMLPDSNKTIFMHGLRDFNYLLPEKDGTNPKKDPRIPGTQQSVISFTKKKTPNIKVAEGDGYPRKVFFNGEECALPPILPKNSACKMNAVTSIFSLFVNWSFFLASAVVAVIEAVQ